MMPFRKRIHQPWGLILAACLALLLAGLFPAAAEETESELYYTLDREDSDTLPGNLRFLVRGEYEFRSSSRPRRNADPAYTPSTAGMDTLCISGSQQYSKAQFHNLAEKIRELAEREGCTQVVIVDCRQEFHACLDAEPEAEGFVNGSSFYLTNDQRNSPNKGREGFDYGETVKTEEKSHFAALLGTAMDVRLRRMRSSAPPRPEESEEAETVTIILGSYQTEEELAAAEGFSYLRLGATDHLWAQADCIDEFITFAKALDMEHTWLHFHCQAGMGRTATFMAIYDMMKNPDVDLKDICYRQSLTGGENLYTSTSPIDGGWSKAEMMRLVYQYIQENRASNYEKSWSRWLADYRETETHILCTPRLRKGQKIAVPASGTLSSTNPLAVSVSGSTLTANRAGDSLVYLISGGTVAAVYRIRVSDDFAQLNLPEKLTSLGESAFSGDEGPAAAVIGADLQTVEAGVFEGTGELQITVDSDDTAFSVHSFGETDSPFFLCGENSKAAAFAEENGYPYFYLKEED